MIARVLTAAAAAIMLFSTAQATERRIVVGVEEINYYPVYAIVDGGFAGAAREILDGFARARGIHIEYRSLPVKRLYAELLTGGIDLKFPDNPRWMADAKAGHSVTYSAPVIAFIDGVMVTPGAMGLGLDSIKLLGTVSGFTPYAWRDRIASGQVQLRENPKFDLLLRQTTIKRVDGAYVNVAVANHMLERVLAMPNALTFDASLPHSRDHYMASTTTRPELIAEFNEWLAANAEFVNTIKANYGAERGIH